MYADFCFLLPRLLALPTEAWQAESRRLLAENVYIDLHRPFKFKSSQIWEKASTCQLFSISGSLLVEDPTDSRRSRRRQRRHNTDEGLRADGEGVNVM
jgi:hypothetical protein